MQSPKDSYLTPFVIKSTVLLFCSVVTHKMQVWKQGKNAI
jgi:hypothetical protein